MTWPLEPSSEEMHRLVDEAMTRIVDHIETLPQQFAAIPADSTAFAKTLIEPLPERGAAYEELLDFLFREAIPRSFNTAGPGYLAYVPGGGIFHSAVADLIANAVNRYVGVCAAAPALVQLEANVVRWFAQILGMPAGSGGLLTSGGSLANFTALVAARRERLPEDFLEGTLYCSEQIHHSFQKAAILAGFPVANVRELPVDEQFRLRLDALEEQVARDRRDGFTPFLVAGSAGTTATGAVDDLDAIATFCSRETLWFHVDGAYGALFNLTERGKKTLRGIERADSVILDPHKTLFLPFGTGALVVRNADALRRAHSLHADYLPAMQEEAELVDFCEISPELSRDFRGLRIWLPLKIFGIEPFRHQLDEKLDLIHTAVDGIRSIEGVEIVAEPQLSIAAFRLTVPSLDREATNALNRRLVDRINARGRVMLTSAMLDGRYVIRICIVSHRTHLDRIAMAIEDIRAAVEEVRP